MSRFLAALIWLAACARAKPQASSPPSVQPQESKSALQNEIDQLADEVAAARGSEWKNPVPVRLMPEDAFDREVKRIRGRDMARHSRELSQMFSVLFFARSFDPTRLAEVMQQGAEGSGPLVGGLYDMESRTILVRKGAPGEPELGADERAETLAHELAHALQDQTGGLDAAEAARTWDAALASHALAEGDATVTANVVLSRRHGVAASGAIQVTSYLMQTGSRFGRIEAPAATRTLLEFLYGDGTRLALGLWRAGGRPALDLALAHPPPSTAAVLHPQPWLEGRQPVALPAAGALASGTFGAMFLRVLLEHCRSDRAAVHLAHLYRGDYYELRQLPSGERQLRWSTHWASPEAAAFARGKLRSLPNCESHRDFTFNKLGEQVVNVVAGSRVLQVQGGAPSEREAALRELRQDDSMREMITVLAPLAALHIPPADIADYDLPPELSRVQGRRWTSRWMGLTAELPEAAISWPAPYLELLAFQRGPSAFIESVRVGPTLDAKAAQDMMRSGWEYLGLICLEPAFADSMPRSCPGIEDPVQRLRSGPVDLGWSQSDETVERLGMQTLRQRVVSSCGGKAAFLFRAWYTTDAGGAAADAWERSIQRLDAEPAICAQVAH